MRSLLYIMMLRSYLVAALKQIENPGSFDLIIVIYLVFFLSSQLYVMEAVFESTSGLKDIKSQTNCVGSARILVLYKEVEHSVWLSRTASRLMSIFIVIYIHYRFKS
jgi:hypothetical protein